MRKRKGREAEGESEEAVVARVTSPFFGFRVLAAVRMMILPKLSVCSANEGRGPDERAWEF